VVVSAGDDRQIMVTDDGLESLGEQECRALLAQGTLGRVGMTQGALPVIVPVNYAVVDGDVVFRTGEGAKLAASRRDAVVAFEVDSYDVGAQRGWSVLAVGRAHEVTDAEELERLRALGLAPWANGERPSFVRMHPEMVSGRRIVDR
jgi:nitroimidazol reductase NimA-like FMN-containing flavoprotein (pyridoxamine 5'-phosphate oxidase superfamily)